MTGRALGLAVAIAVAACAPQGKTARSPSGALPLPVPLEPGQPSFSDAIAGKVVLIDFWATWCEACREAFPQLNALTLRSDAEQLVVLGVNVGESGPQARVFASQAGLNYPVYLDPEFAYSDAVGERKLPALILLDRRGDVVHRAERFDDALLHAVEAQVAAGEP